MKILVTGSRGQLGTELRNMLEARHPGLATYIDKEELDITDAPAVESYLRQNTFTHVINCAAYTDVERAEDDKLACASVNIDGIKNFARISDELGIRIVHISTDYVFDGTAHRPYTESDKVNPVSQYGTTKRKGETALLGLAPDSIIVRTGWLYSPYGRNFVKTILKLARTNKTIKVVSDQIGTPTNARDLAEAIEAIVFAPQWVPGIFNFSNEGACSWYDVAMAVLRNAGITDVEVKPIPSEDYPSQVSRPYYSVLDKQRIKATFGLTIPHWEKSLERCVGRIKADMERDAE